MVVQNGIWRVLRAARWHVWDKRWEGSFPAVYHRRGCQSPHSYTVRELDDTEIQFAVGLLQVPS
jgi:hypothetical protein